MSVRIRWSFILCGVLLFSTIFLMEFNEQLSFSAEEEEQEPSAFALPEKHETGLTRKEQRGKVFYEYYCVLCHGSAGKGDGFNSFTLSTAPAKHADASYMDPLSDSYIRLVIKKGGASQGRSPLMPPWGNVLDDKEISYLISFIRTLAHPGGSTK